MNLVAVIWSMLASACLTLALVYLMVWFQKRSQKGYLFFSLAAIGTAGLTFCEVWGGLAAFRMQEASKLALLPTIALNLEGGHLSNGITSLLRLNPWMFRSAISMRVPVYTGGALSAQIRITTAQQEKVIR